MLGVDLVGSRWIEAAHVGWLVGPDGSSRIQRDRLDDQSDDQSASDKESDGKVSGGRGLTVCGEAATLGALGLTRYGVNHPATNGVGRSPTHPGCAPSWARRVGPRGRELQLARVTVRVGVVGLGREVDVDG